MDEFEEFDFEKLREELDNYKPTIFDKIRWWWHRIHGFRWFKYAWQRVFRGWDDRVVWGIDYHLAEYMPQWIESLIEHAYAVSLEFFEPDDKDCEDMEGAIDRQKETWQRIADGFRAKYELDTCCYRFESDEWKERDKKLKEGMELFVRYFHTLND